MILLVATLVWRKPVEAQDSWEWPERAKNLQILPADFSPDRLRAVMTGFTRALGVRCSYCHIGEEGKPLSTYDFASDVDPEKNTARKMLKMLGVINDHLKEVKPGPTRVNMWCHTCHQGRPRPQTLEETLTEALNVDGLKAMIARYRDLRERYYGKGAYDFSQVTLNNLGYALLGEGKLDAASAVFRLNVEFFPDSANAYDSLAESYLKRGEKELAIVYYQKSLQLDPDNKNAIENVRRLGAGD